MHKLIQTDATCLNLLTPPAHLIRIILLLIQQLKLLQNGLRVTNAINVKLLGSETMLLMEVAEGGFVEKQGVGLELLNLLVEGWLLVRVFKRVHD